MNVMKSSFMIRPAMHPGVCAGVLLATAGLLFGSVALGQGKNGPQRTFATPAEAAKALGTAYREPVAPPVRHLWSPEFLLRDRGR
jgi:hypothetical protein